MRIMEFMSRRPAMIFHLLSGFLVFALWRIAGLPSPGTLGRLVPLSLVFVSLICGRIRIPRLSILFLLLFILFSLFWRVDPIIGLLAAVSAILILFPGLLTCSSTGIPGLIKASVPLLLLIVLLVPFEGDEPHYAAITERLAGGGTEKFGDPGSQIGDLGGGETHHQKVFPLLLLPGYPLGLAGVRSVSFLLAVASAVMMALLLRREGISEGTSLAYLCMVLLPGVGILGLLYPGWISVGLLCVGVIWGSTGTRGLFVTGAVALALMALKFRFFPLGAGLFLVWFLRLQKKRKILIGLLLIGGLGALLIVDLIALGGSLFWKRYGNTGVPLLILTNITVRTGCLFSSPINALLDIESGLLWKAPWVMLSLLGLPELRKRYPDLFLRLGLPSLLYAVALFLWQPESLHGLPTPPGRLFVPLLPILIASAAMVLKKPSAKIIIWISIFLTVLCMAHPALRFNHADGTDSMVLSLTGNSHSLIEWLPSQFRPVLPAFLASGVFLAVTVLFLSKTRWGVIWVFLAAAVIAGSISRDSATVWEAEDLGSANRIGCVLYPRNIDPEQRHFWFFKRQLMLRMEHHYDRILLPLPEGENDTVTVEISLTGFGQEEVIPGLMVRCGNNSLISHVSSPLLAAPEWVGSFGRNKVLDRRPENLADTVIVFRLPCSDQAFIEISPVLPSAGRRMFFGIYLDKIEVSR